ncbi:DUF669 domain-containing protein [Dolosicoccus paucivorans]|uniref:DUF669 domain-containing protein n=1 Tax=Dolosicoccus paucivorans TaxID=84521 RepID=UPI000881C303|nr:DUF669 domain-containing protein [Dolosicoccus paucivorans]SDI40505.1 Protein of unknown function [Dolosicoccus paucivorans]
MFKTDYSNLNQTDYKPVPEGEYEVIIHKVEERVSQTGNRGLSIRLDIRRDLKQVPELAETNGKYAGRVVFDNRWQSNGKYNTEHFMYLLQAVGVPEGTEIKSMNDLYQAIEGKPVRVFIKKEYSEYRKEEENSIAPWAYNPTRFSNVQVESNPFVTEEDLPF